MPFLNIPLKTLQSELVDIMGTDSMPWYDPALFPVVPGNPEPDPVNIPYRWRVTLNINIQQQSSYLTRSPGSYNGQDVTVGQWIANSTTGQSWQIISIELKTVTQVVVIVQDIYRYNTFRDPFKSGNGSPPFGSYLIFSLSDAGLPQIDPIPDAGVSATFTQNLQSRFEYINLQYDYPLYQAGNTFGINDVVAVDTVTNNFVFADSSNKLVIGRVTSISDTIPGWFTVNPVQKIVDNLDYLPGEVGDIIYSSTVDPEGVSTSPTGAQLYIKLRNHTASITTNLLPGPTAPGNVFTLNGRDITVGGSGDIDDMVTAVNLESTNTGVVAAKVLAPNIAITDPANITPTYGEIVLWATTSPAQSTINGVLVTFDIPSTTPGYEDYTQASQMATAINNANIPNIVAFSSVSQELRITNTIGGAITISTVTSDVNGVSFSGISSGTGIIDITPASTTYQLNFEAIDARSINLLDVAGSAIEDYGINSVENGTKACGLYIENGLRQANSSVVSNLVQLSSLSPLIGDQAYVIDSNDGSGNNVGEWSQWLFDGTSWVQTSNQDSATSDAKSLESTFDYLSPTEINMGHISTGTRVTLITVEVLTPFDTPASLSIGYIVNNPTTPQTSVAGLMVSDLIDLTVSGTYTTSTDVLFGTDTEAGDVEVTAHYINNGATVGEAQIIISYV